MKGKTVLFLSKGFAGDHPMLLRWKSYYKSRGMKMLAAHVNWDMFGTSSKKKLRLLLKWRLFLFTNKVDFIHVNDLESGMVASHLTRKFGIKYVYSANEIFSHELPVEKEGDFTYGVKLSAELTVLTHASLVLVPNTQRIGIFKNLHPTVSAGKYRLVENKSLTSNATFVDQKFVTSLPKVPTVFYGGSFWYGRRQEDFPRLADCLAAENYALVLSGGHNEYLQKLLLESQHIHYVGNIPPEQFDNFIEYVDICLAWYYPTTLNDELCAPLKLFDFLKAGKQVVAPALPYIKTIAEQYKGAIHLFEPGNYKDCLQKINNILNEKTTSYVDVNTVTWESQYTLIASYFKEAFVRKTKKEKSISV